MFSHVPQVIAGDVEEEDEDEKENESSDSCVAVYKMSLTPSVTCNIPLVTCNSISFCYSILLHLFKPIY